jgi:hypothetical protein
MKCARRKLDFWHRALPPEGDEAVTAVAPDTKGFVEPL